ncbi:phytoene desaturase [Actinokineospora alba]|uniref:Phytoene desaturase n=1 Tax=Actinokineospora alba TaxID=504798 RepID=A0A1H0JL88_9PSEU|nr:phytoene desaturase family protein [Actinokineospora alba]TDP68258.1 phytoene desaturase [Actinokineospora alba]SDH95339.1 phytoene desaturase [Actinokineospora alba]SDO44199.1 phytoene desaturase [Actinokineospora alba]
MADRKTIPGRTDHVVAVGAGLSGLSAALHLAGTGREVTVIEAAAKPGGRAGQETIEGYRVDTGATVLTMPELIDEAFAAVGTSLAAEVDLIKLDPAYRARFADGSTIAVHTDAAAMEAEIREAAGPREAEGYRRLRAWLTDLYQVQRDRFIGANFDSPTDLVGPELARLAALGGFGRLGPAVGRFLSDDRLRRLFSFQALYAGVPPSRALAAYAVIAYMDTVAGVSFPRGGVGAVAEAMAGAAARAGVRVRYSTSAAWLERVGTRVGAVRTTTGERIACDTVVLTADLAASYRLLGVTPRRPLALRYSPSAVVLHTGTTRSWPELDHHTIFFGRAWERTFREITREGVLMSDPSLLVTRPTATDPTLAPEGRHQISVLAPCPNLRTGPIDWRRIGPRYRDDLVRVLEQRGLTGFDSSIEMQRLVTPADWEAAGLAEGSPFSVAHTFAQTGPFRPRNLVRGVDNVVLAGSGTTPGVGIPPVVISGRLAAQRIAGRLVTATGVRGKSVSGL